MDGTTTNIGTLAAEKLRDAAAQDSFCAGTTCTIAEIFDQSPQHQQPRRSGQLARRGGCRRERDRSAGDGRGVQGAGVFMSPGTGYRDDAATAGVATGARATGKAYVGGQRHPRQQRLLLDYGNAETNNRDNGNGRVDTVYFGALCWFARATDPGPWVQADLENGLFGGGNGNNPNNAGNKSAFVTALVKNNGTTTYAIKGGNAQDLGGLTIWYSGSLPQRLHAHAGRGRRHRRRRR